MPDLAAPDIRARGGPKPYWFPPLEPVKHEDKLKLHIFYECSSPSLLSQLNRNTWWCFDFYVFLKIMLSIFFLELQSSILDFITDSWHWILADPIMATPTLLTPALKSPVVVSLYHSNTDTRPVYKFRNVKLWPKRFGALCEGRLKSCLPNNIFLQSPGKFTLLLAMPPSL